MKEKNLFSKFKNGYAFIPPSWRFSIATWLGLRMFYAVWGMIVVSLFPLSVQNFEYQGISVVPIFNLETSQAYLYERQVGEELLTFRMLDNNTIFDEQTGSHWLVSIGAAFRGAFTGYRLTRSNIPVEEIFPYLGVQPYPYSFLSIWQRFDTNWYLSIAERGYGAVSGDKYFPPLYPALIRLVGFFTGDLFFAGLLISHLASLLVIRLLYNFFGEWLPPVISKRAFLFFLIFPASYYLFAAYSESLYFLFVLSFLFLSQKRAWILAGVCVSLATLTRLHGVALLPVLLYAMYMDKPFLQKRSHWLGLFISGMGGVLYIFLRYVTGSDSVLPVAESTWQFRLAFPWEAFIHAFRYLFSGRAAVIDVINLILVITLIVLLLFGWKKMPKIYSLYAVFAFLSMLPWINETQPFVSAVRYSLSLFPVFGLLGIYAQRKMVERFLVILFLLFMLYFSAQFWLWGWVA